MSVTKASELPLHYKHSTKPGTLVLSFSMDDKGKVLKKQFFWAIQSDDGKVADTDHGEVKSLKELDKIRNEFIYVGWQRYFPPKIQIKDENRRATSSSTTNYCAVSNPHHDKARLLAFEKIKKDTEDKTNLWFMKN